MKPYYKFILFTIIVLAAIFTIENINGRFWLSDFKVYYLAAKAYVSGEQVYGRAFGLDTGFYKYSPFVMLFFVPYGFLTFHAACVIHFILLCVAVIWAMLIVQQIVDKTLLFRAEKKQNLLLGLAFLCIANHLVRELHLGNVNVIIVLLLSSSLLSVLKNKELPAGVLLALAVMIKPYLIILALPLLLQKKFKVILSLGFSILFSILLVFIISGVSKATSLHLDWLKAMMEHNSYLGSNHTISSLLSNYLHLNIPGSFQFYILTMVCLLYVFYSWYFLYRSQGLTRLMETENIKLAIGYFSLLALIPNILVTDTEHFLYSIPLIVILINYLAIIKNNVLTIIFVVVIILYGANSSDLLGSQLSDLFEAKGFLGLANLGIVIFALSIILNKSYTQKLQANL